MSPVNYSLPKYVTIEVAQMTDKKQQVKSKLARTISKKSKALRVFRSLCFLMM